MRPRRRTGRRTARRQRGAALIIAILCMSLLFALALALLLSTTTDTLISASYRWSEEAFFAADAGVSVGRRAVSRAMTEQIQLIVSDPKKAYRPATQILPDSASAPNATFFQAVSDRATELANDEARSTLGNDSKYKIEVVSFEGGPSSTPIRNPRNGLETYIFRYELKSTGRGAGGARAEVVERGELRTELTAAIRNNRVPYSAYGTFFDNGDPGRGLTLVSGTFTGPVHTNSHFVFSSRNSVTFRGKVSQSEANIVYDGRSVPIPAEGMKGVTVGKGSFEQTPPVPLPKNNYLQELAVIDASGYGNSAGQVDGNGRVTPDALAHGLTNASGEQPVPSSTGIPPGVYVGSGDGAQITGGGVYVNGDAQIQLAASGGNEVITITQGGTTSTVTIDYAAQQTTLRSGGLTRSFIGVPMDNSLGAGQGTPAVSLFVNGAVTSLSGPQAVDGQTAPAISPNTALTVTAQRDITITGDLKYADPVVGPDGTPLPRANQNQSVLGIFTNDGNVVLQPDPTRTDGGGNSLEVDAAIAAFDSNPKNNGGRTEGAILFGAGSPRGGSSLRIVGARIQSNIANIKFRKRGIYFDPRLAGGQFAPPFFPGTEISAKPSPLEIGFAGEQSVYVYVDGWQRDERRRDKKKESAARSDS